MNTKTITATCVVAMPDQPAFKHQFTTTTSALKKREVRLEVRKQIRTDLKCSNKDIKLLTFNMLVAKRVNK